VFKVSQDGESYYRSIESTVFSAHGDSYADKCSMN
jgi:hypothetical protein